MKERFEQLPQREQILLVSMVFVVVFYLLYMFAWMPLKEANNVLKRQNEVAVTELSEVRQLADEYRRIEAGLNTTNGGEESLSKIIDQVTNNNKLSMGRFQPGSNGDIQIRFSDAKFDSLLFWLGELEAEHGVSIKELSLLPGSEAGLVRVSVKLSLQ